MACNLDTYLLQTALPLLHAEKVEAIEWAFDSLYKHRNIPDWFLELLKTFGEQGRLIGHGVYFSLFKGTWTQEQADWLKQLRKVVQHFKFDHISEHFGFMTGEDFHKGAPLHIPLNKSTLAIGKDRLSRIQDACQLPVGLENLAFAYCLDDVQAQGNFLNQLLKEINGFLILDIHNLYCQMHNFNLAADQIIAAYDLNRVREIHISGGSWSANPIESNQQIRRDTHDDAVPNLVFSLLAAIIPQCPNLKFVVLEQLGNGLQTAASQNQFHADFSKMGEIVKRANHTPTINEVNAFLPIQNILNKVICEDPVLQSQQNILSSILEEASDYRDAATKLNSSILSNTDWKVEEWSPAMLGTALEIAQKWKAGFWGNPKS